MTREEAIKILQCRDGYGLPSGYNGGCAEAIEVAIEALKAEPKHGRWIDSNNGVYHCSNCGQLQIGETLEIMTGDFRFCPYCGSKNEVTECGQ